MNEIDQLIKMATRRYYSHKNRCNELNKPEPDKNEFIIKLIDNYNNGFKCGYCGKPMAIKQNYPYSDLPSIDHYIPITMGGSSRIENLFVCCVACNLVKGTLKGDTYKQLLSKIGIGSTLFNDIFNESFNGKLGNKIERIDEEKT